MWQTEHWDYIKKKYHFLIPVKTIKNPILPHTSSTLDVHPWGDFIPQSHISSSQPPLAINSGGADINSIPWCPRGGCSHNEDEHIYITLTSNETEVQNRAPQHVMMNKIQGLISIFQRMSSQGSWESFLSYTLLKLCSSALIFASKIISALCVVTVTGPSSSTVITTTVIPHQQ